MFRALNSIPAKSADSGEGLRVDPWPIRSSSTLTIILLLRRLFRALIFQVLLLYLMFVVFVSGNTAPYGAQNTMVGHMPGRRASHATAETADGAGR